MSGLMGGSWRRGSPAGRLRVPGRCAGKCHHDGLVGTQLAGHLQPRQLPTRLQHGVSKDAFAYLHQFTWLRVVGWLRRKHRRANWLWLRRHYLANAWWPEHDGEALFDCRAVPVTRYRYRGSAIPSPWAETTEAS